MTDERDLRELVDRDRALRLRPRHVEPFGDRGEFGQDAFRVFVAEHGDDDGDLGEVEVLGHRRRQRARTVRVVGGIHEHCRLDADQLEAAG